MRKQSGAPGDPTDLTIQATQKDYSRRPDPKAVYSVSPTTGKQKGLVQKDKKSPSLPQNQLQAPRLATETSFERLQRQGSPSISVPRTVDTVFMSAEKSPAEMAADYHEGVP